MAAIRFRSRHLHASFVADITARLAALGWSSTPANFGTDPVTVVDFQPDERATQVATNTVAVSLGDFTTDADEELGASEGGLRSAPYTVFVDVFMAEQALALAICDDIRDMYVDTGPDLIDQITGNPVPGTEIEINQVLGPERNNAAGAQDFRRNWRTMRIDATLYYSS